MMHTRAGIRHSLSLFVGSAFAGLALAQTPENLPIPYRVGIVAYDDIQGRALVMKDCFGRLGFDLRFASGTAEEVLDWVTDGRVDIAVVSPGALAATGAVLRVAERNSRIREHTLPAWDCRYLVTPELPASLSPFASMRRRQKGQFTYEALCVINKACWNTLRADYSGTDAEIVRKAANAGRIQFVFGDPLSLSGTIVPLAQLKSMGVDPGRNREFSFGHKDTIALLMDEPKIRLNDRELFRLGFIYDASVPEVSRSKPGSTQTTLDALIARMGSELTTLRLPRPKEPAMFATEIEKLRRQVGSLDDNAVDDLPGEVWVVRPNFGVANTEKLRRALLGLNEKGFGFADQNDPEIVPNAIDLLSARVQLWTREAGIDLGKLGGTRAITFAEIIDSMRHFARRYNQSPRLALVLSGGGAKCAYQAGAIGSIEKHLLELQDYLVPDPNSVHPDDKPAVHPDVSLVVGTSGGALNALPTAIGTTAGRDGAAARPLAQIWSSIYLLDFFRPYWPVSATLGLFWAALICSGTRIATVTFHASKRWAIHDNRPAFQSTEYEPTIFALRLAAISILILIILLQLYLPGQLYSLGPENRWLFYIAWLPLCICAPWAATFLLFISIGERVLLKRGLLRSVPQETHLWRGFGFICAAGLLLAVTVLCLHKSLSSGDKMQEVIVSKILQILRNDVRPNESILGDQEQRATALSAAICEEGMVRRRDLVMTVSLLGAPGDADRYVYLPAIAEDRPPSYEQRAIKLQRGIGMNFIEDENQVVKLMVASGTIFPVFPARPFVDPAGASQDLYVVDGGFAHNTPIEAAVDWGATHIIVIEASPEITIREKGSFLQNIGSAFDHLFAQAQLTDVRSRQKVEIYTLRPDREILKTLDFMPARIRRAIAQGEQDVEDGRFRQFSRPPTLLSVVGEKDGKQ